MKLSDIIGDISKLSTDQKLAVNDALSAIIQSRIDMSNLANGAGGGGAAGGDIDLPIDPDLKKPQQYSQPSQDSGDVEIDDPDNLLDSNNNNNNNNTSNSSSSSSNSSSQNQDGQNGQDSQEQANSEANSSQSSDKSENSPSGSAKSDAMDGRDISQDIDNNLASQQNTADSDETNSNKNSEEEKSKGTKVNDSNSANSDNPPLENKNFDKDQFDGTPDAPDFNSVDDEHAAPTGKNLRKIERARSLNLANKALNKGESINADKNALDRLQKAADTLENLSDDELENMSEDNFNDKINKVLDAIDEIIPVPYSKDIENRLKKIKSEFNDTKALQRAAKETGLDDQDVKDQEQEQKNKIIAREKAKERYSKIGVMKALPEFLRDFTRAIREQVDDMYEEEEEETWTRVNSHYAGSNIIRPGSRYEDVQKGFFPVIDIYMDCSGSWGAEETKVAEKAIASVIGFEKRGEIKTNLFYFADTVGTSPYGIGSSTEAWTDIVANIRATHAKNVVIITDDDMQYQGGKAPITEVDGLVWYIWKDKRTAKRLPKELHGKQGTLHYYF